MRLASETYHFCLEDQEGMKLFEFWRSTQGFLGYIELPGEAVGIPHRQVVDGTNWLQPELVLTMEGPGVEE